MKTKSDPRHLKRRVVVKEIFANSFTKQPSLSDLTKKVLSKLSSIDERIYSAAPAWPIDRLNKVDLAVLRLAVYELLYENIPPKVVIDEAVELAKEFGAENSSAFINGVLGTVLAKKR